MTFHATVHLTYLQKPAQLWEFDIDPDSLRAQRLEQVLHQYEKAHLFHCKWVEAWMTNRPHWRIDEEGMAHIVPHFANFSEMREQAFSQETASTWTCAMCGSSDIHARCQCHDAPLCDEHYRVHVPQSKRDNTTYSYHIEFLDKDGHPLRVCCICAKPSHDFIKVETMKPPYERCGCVGKTYCRMCYEQHKHTATCHTCPSTKIYGLCACHDMPLCSTCYHSHMEEEKRQYLSTVGIKRGGQGHLFPTWKTSSESNTVLTMCDNVRHNAALNVRNKSRNAKNGKRQSRNNKRKWKKRCGSTGICLRMRLHAARIPVAQTGTGHIRIRGTFPILRRFSQVRHNRNRAQTQHVGRSTPLLRRIRC